MHVLAIDGGGTKTIATISTCHGQIMALAETGKSNPTSMSFEHFTETITELINNLKDNSLTNFNTLQSAMRACLV